MELLMPLGESMGNAGRSIKCIVLKKRDLKICRWNVSTESAAKVLFQSVTLAYDISYRYLYTLDNSHWSGVQEPDQTVEVLMQDLNPEVMDIFTKKVSRDGKEATMVCICFLAVFYNLIS